MRDFIDKTANLFEAEDIIARQANVLGTIKSDDGGEVTIYDLENFKADHCMIRQVFDGQNHDIVVSKKGAIDLAHILASFGK